MESNIQKLVKNNKSTVLLTGTSKDIDVDCLFSTVQLMNNNIENLK